MIDSTWTNSYIFSSLLLGNSTVGWAIQHHSSQLYHNSLSCWFLTLFWNVLNFTSELIHWIISHYITMALTLPSWTASVGADVWTNKHHVYIIRQINSALNVSTCSACVNCFNAVYRPSIVKFASCDGVFWYLSFEHNRLMNTDDVLWLQIGVSITIILDGCVRT